MSFLLAGTAIVSAGVGLAKAIGSNKRQKAAERKEAKARAEMDKQKAAFAGLDTSNPFLNMENMYEDLTVNQQQAQFQSQQNQQQQANIMSGLRGAAGGSGIASLAQAMAQQGQLATQRTSASIGQQEAMNQKLIAQGATAIQSKERSGEVMSRNWERDKVSTMLGMSQQEVAAYRQQAAMAEQQKQDAMAGVASSVMTGVTAGVSSGAWEGDITPFWQPQ